VSNALQAIFKRRLLMIFGGANLWLRGDFIMIMQIGQGGCENVALAQIVQKIFVLNPASQERVQATMSKDWVKPEGNANIQKESEDITNDVQNVSGVRAATNNASTNSTRANEELKRAARESSARSRAANKRLTLL
jgi:hypothetical protein